MRKRIIIFAHVIFWILVTVLPVFSAFTLTTVAETRDWIIRILVSKVYFAGAFYAFYFYLGPKILVRKKIFLFLIVLLVFNIAYSVFVALTLPYVYGLVLSNLCMKQDFLQNFYSALSYLFIYSVYGTMFRFTIDWFETKKRQKELERTNIAGELALLRSQINPQFLFDTLNNINSYVKRDPDKTSFGIIKLSEIMRYMLYESNSEKVLLSSEINYIKSYIELQKLRFPDPDFIRFSCGVSTVNMRIPPLLLIPFIENACKYCKTNVEAPGITINMETSGKQLNFEVINYIYNKNEGESQDSGTGLINIKRRLNLLYPGNYSLEISTENEKFHVRLILANDEN